MNKLIYLLTAVFCVMVTACAPECDQKWGENNNHFQILEVYASTGSGTEPDPVAAGAMLILENKCEEVGVTDGTDRIISCDWEKKNIGTDFTWCPSTTKDFRYTLKESTWFANGCVNINAQKGTFSFVIDVNVTFYSYVEFSDGTRTGIQEHRFFDEESENTIEVMCRGVDRLAQTTLVSESITRLASDVGGVTMTRLNDRGTCVFENTNAKSVNVMIAKESEDISVVELDRFDPHTTNEVPCVLIDTVGYDIKIWENDFDTDLQKIKNSVNETHPSKFMHFIWNSQLPTISLTTVASYETQQFNIDAAGVVCAIAVDNSGEVMAELSCENGSSTDVEINLVKMKSNDVTDGTFIEDFDVVTFSLSNTGGSADTDSGTFDLHNGCYAIKVTKEVLYYNTETIGKAGFCAGLDIDGWIFEILDEEVVIVK